MTLAISMMAWAIPQENVSSDSARTLQADSARPEQLVPRFIPAIGSVLHMQDTSSAFSSRQFLWTDAKYPGDLLLRVPGFFLRDLGEVGQPAQLIASGYDDRGISIHLDGRPLTDPIMGTFRLSDIPLEFVDNVEVIQGSGSSYVGTNAPAASLNFVSRQYNNARPLTKIRYLQGPYEQILSDGIFAQNVTRGVNAMVGFQRQVTDGRFPNSKYDSWNVRSRVRYNHSDRLNIWISDFYNRSTTGLNGGVDLKRSTDLYDEVTAAVRNRTAGQTIFRRDVTIGTTAKLLPDTVSTSQALFYYSVLEREYREGGGLLDPASFTDLHIASYWGAKLQQQVVIPMGFIEVGADYERRLVSESRTVGGRAENYLAVRGLSELAFGELIETELSARGERLRNQTSLSVGVRFCRRLGEGTQLFADYARSYRLPTMFELYWTDSTVVRSPSIGRELHTLLGVGLQVQIGTTFDWSITLIDRTVTDAIVFTSIASSRVYPTVQISSVPTVTQTSLTSSLTARAWGFELAAAVSYTHHKEGDTEKLAVPQYTAWGELSYRRVCLDGAFDGKVAVRGRGASRQYGLQFIPPLLAFASQRDVELGASSAIDLYAVLHLGDAYLTLVWENPLNVNYSVTPYYPMPSRNIKLGVNWVFID